MQQPKYIDGSNLSVADNFKYLGSIISSNLSLDVKINARFGKAAIVMAKLNKRVRQNISLTMNTWLKVYQTCVTSIFLYKSETWRTYARQETKLNSFHLHCLRQILGITWQDRIPNTTVLEKAKCSSIHAVLSQRRWDTYAGWEKEGFQTTSSMVSLKRVHVKLAAHSFASEMFARGIWNLQPLTKKVASLWSKIAPHGGIL